jgi:hypothetical protein
MYEMVSLSLNIFLSRYSMRNRFVDLQKKVIRINPTFWAFVIALVFIGAGLLLHISTFIRLGLFVMAVYLIIWIAWVISSQQ